MKRLIEIAQDKVKIFDANLVRHQKENRDYLLELSIQKLLVPHMFEAGRYKTNDLPVDIYGGWEAPTSQLRGHFLGHWLSACAMNYEMTGDSLIKAKAEAVVEELEKCQIANGGSWAASIPEKYLNWISQGIEVWAPQYNIHKTFMGLLDIYIMAGNKKALIIADKFGEWFYNWSGKFSKEEFQNILEVETGGMLEIWAILYQVTKKEIYKALIKRYYRESLFDDLLQGKDVLTNMHANTTIPEILGAASVYEATGDIKYLTIVKEYWRQAVVERECFATGGQTCGEVWTPKHKLNTRLGNKTQEHCTVYNMMRLAKFLFCYDADSSYMDYWEKNMYNGILAQSYWDGFHVNVAKTKYPSTGFMTYFLPMQAGSRKAWRGKYEYFFCCHGTVVQANAALNRGIYYKGEECIYVCQYFDSDCNEAIHGKEIRIRQRKKEYAEGFEYQDKPANMELDFYIEYEGEREFSILFRIPKWCNGKFEAFINGKRVDNNVNYGFISVCRNWNKDIIHIIFERKIYTEKLPGNENMVAFLDGPEVLAGLTKKERTLYCNSDSPEKMVVPECDREWEAWTSYYRVNGQKKGLHLIPLNKVGYEKYQIYFPATDIED